MNDNFMRDEIYARKSTNQIHDSNKIKQESIDVLLTKNSVVTELGYKKNEMPLEECLKIFIV